MAKPVVVIESLALDVHAYAVSWALKQLGIEPLHIFADNFPNRATLDLRICKSGKVDVIYRGPEGEHHLGDEDELVYLARRSGGPVLPEYVVASDRAAAVREATAQLWGMRELISTFRRCVTVNDHSSRRRAERKPLQLIVAKRCGFKIPASLFSNDGKSVRTFLRDNPEGVIYKTNTPLIWQQVHGKGRVTSFMSFSQLLAAKDIPSDEVARISNGIYQTEIRKQFEVRVVVMGSACFASKLYSQASTSTAVDWRANQDELRTEPCELPSNVEASCISYLRQMGLLFGCFDFVVTPEGDWVFLECNQQGQWLWQEASCPELPLLDAYVRFIISPSRDFRYSEQCVTFRLMDYRSSNWQEDYGQAMARHEVLGSGDVVATENAFASSLV